MRFMKILKDKKLKYPIHLGPTDTLSVDFNGDTILTTPIGNHMIVDRVVVYEIHNEFGFKTGLAAMVGESE
jgi:hypothetical protein